MSGSADASAADEFTELEVRAGGGGDSVKFYNALFPDGNRPVVAQGRRPTGVKGVKRAAAGADAAKGPAKRAPYPPFGTKDFPAPVHLRLEEPEEDADAAAAESDEEDELGPGYRRFKKRRNYATRKEKRWVLTDKKKRNVFYGEPDGQAARYFVMIPPSAERPHDPFRIVPVKEWIEFKKPPGFRPLSITESKEMQEKKVALSKIEERMAERAQELAEEEDAARKIGQKRRDDDVFASEDLLQSDDDAEIKSKSRKARTAKMEDDEEEVDDEEDIDVLAIDRQTRHRGMGEDAGDADYEEEFQDDEDDGNLLNEEDQINNNEDTLIQGAEELGEAISEDEDEDEMDDDDADSDEDESEEEEGEQYEQDMEAFLKEQLAGNKANDEEDAELQRQQFIDDHRKTKVLEVDLGSTSAPGASSSSAQGAAAQSAEAKTAPAGASSSSTGEGGAGAATKAAASGVAAPVPADNKSSVAGSGNGAAPFPPATPTTSTPAATTSTPAAATGTPPGSGVKASDAKAKVKAESKRAGASPARTASRKQKPPREMFRDSVIRMIRQSDGIINVAKLFTLATKKKNLKQVNLKKTQAQAMLSDIVKEVADIKEDPITREMQAKLKQRFV